jgi:hypothetical protein
MRDYFLLLLGNQSDKARSDLNKFGLVDLKGVEAWYVVCRTTDRLRVNYLRSTKMA